jgi:hypothetical protein
MTGSIDVPGGNLHLAQVPVNDVSGNELCNAAQWQKALGLAERPLGLGKSGWILSDDLYRAVIEAEPYRVRGLVGFGINLLLSHADAARGAEALRQLEFHVHTDLPAAGRQRLGAVGPSRRLRPRSGCVRAGAVPTGRSCTTRRGAR